MQETNIFAVGASTSPISSATGSIAETPRTTRMQRTNTEMAGACEAVAERGAECVPLIRAWAMSGPPLSPMTFQALGDLLFAEASSAEKLDGLVLSLHGALSAEGTVAADAALALLVREAVGPDVVIGLCLDLHANVTDALLEPVDFTSGTARIRTSTRRRPAAGPRTWCSTCWREAAHPVSALVKRPLLIPPETSDTARGPLGALRAAADVAQGRDGVLDASLFTVQPWLDVPDLGFAAVVTADGDERAARAAAEELAKRAWERRAEFAVPLVEPIEAIRRARGRLEHPVLLSESSDSPTAGASADSPAMVKALLEHGADLRALVTVVDAPAVERCFDAGLGAMVRTHVGASIDRRYHLPYHVSGTVTALRDEPVILAGPVWAGMEVSMGRAAVLRSGSLHVLVSEQPACTFDVAPFWAMGLDPAEVDVVVVRSATLFRAGFVGVMRGEPLFLDLPGPSTPRLSRLTYERAPRPLYPLEDL